MKKTLLCILTIIGVLLVSISCATSVYVDALVPGTVNMSTYRNIAVAPTTPYSGSVYTPGMRFRGDAFQYSFSYTTSPYFAEGLADETGRSIVESLSATGYFNITSPEETGRLSASAAKGKSLESVLAENNIDAVVYTALTEVCWDEYAYSEPNRTSIYDSITEQYIDIVNDYEYFVFQKVSLKLNVRVVDTRTGKVIANDNYGDSYTKDTKLFGYAGSIPNLGEYAGKIITGISGEVARLLAPTYQRVQVNLIGNKPANKRADAAYGLVRDGNLNDAYEIFRAEWDQHRHVPSGCNAAILLEALGNPKEALQLCSEVYSLSGNEDAGETLIRMKDAASQREKAEQQLADPLKAPEK